MAGEFVGGGTPLIRVAGLTLLFGALHAAISMAAGPTLAMDDVKLNVLTQSFQWGYLPSNPPLFEWFLFVVQRATGPTLLSFVIVKYALLTATASLTFLAAHEALQDARWAMLTALSLVLSYQIGYNFHQAFTHSAALAAATAAFWWALLRLFRTRTLTSYLILGAATGVGALAKYSFLPALALALAAAALRPESRRLILSPKIIASLVVATLILSPHIAWTLAENRDVLGGAASRLVGEEDSYLRRIGQGFPEAIWTVVSFLFPFLAVGLLVAGRRAISAALPPAAALARRATLLAVFALPASVILFGFGGMQERYALALLFPVIFWFGGALKSAADNDRARRILLIGVAVLAGASVTARIIEYAFPGRPFCDKCRQWTPYDALKDALVADGFSTGTLVGFEDNTAGNLRRLFPQSRVISAHLPYYIPPGGREGGRCYFVWSEDLGPTPPAHVLRRLDPARTQTVRAVWARSMREEEPRSTTWRISDLTGNKSLASSLCRFKKTTDTE